MNKVFNSPSQPGRIKAVFGAQCQWQWLASSAGTSLEANMKHITVTLATWDAVWEVTPRSQQRDQPVRGLMWCLVVAPRKPPQPPCSQAATQPAASEPGPSTPPPAKRSKRTMAEQAAEPTQPTKGTGKGKGNAAKAKPAPRPGRWLDRDSNAALEHAAHWGEQVAPTGAVLVARPGSSAGQGQGVPRPGLQAAARQATQGPATAAEAQQCVPLISQQTVPAMSQRDMQHQVTVDGGASATDGYSPAGEAPPPATRLLDLPPALLDDIACRVMQLGARSLLPLTCHAFSQARLLHVPALRIQLGRQCCDQLLTPRVLAALQARTSKLSLTLEQPETEDSKYYKEHLAPTLQLPQTEYTQDYTVLLGHALAKLGSCAAVEVCKLGLCVSSDALASLLSHLPLALQLQQLHLTKSGLEGDAPGAVGTLFQGLRLKQLSIAAQRPKQPGTPPLPSLQPLAQHLTQLDLSLRGCDGNDTGASFFREFIQPLAQLQVLIIHYLFEEVQRDGLTEVLQALPQLHTLRLPNARVEGYQQLDTLLAAT
ncbi:hypothetical protein QJQ45_005438 [Haematococcus lacustris]|nr:hypothetical protein QJQ45_005438 [Haematococcus lacustris]